MAGYDPGVIFREKLQRLIEGRDQASVARDAGINPPTLNNYLNEKRSTRPSADAAVALAKYFNCDLSWLLDDSRDWGDRSRPHSLSGVPDDLLQYEIRQRYIQRAIAAKDATDKLKSIDWKKAFHSLKSLKPNDAIPASCGFALAAVNTSYVLILRAQELAMVEDMSDFPVHVPIPDGVRIGELEFPKLKEAAEAARKQIPGLHEFLKLMNKKLAEVP
jgi:transcriptional regulator with XRE-family HTH domain